MMNLDFSAEELAFQQEVRAFLAERLPPHIVEATANNSSVFVDKDIALEWQAILVERGWAVPQWPAGHGGTDWTPAQKYLFSKECYLAGAPMLIPLGLLMLAPVLMAARGWSAPEVGTAIERAQQLVSKFGTVEDRFFVMWGLWGWRVIRADMDICASIADEIMQLVEQSAKLVAMVKGKLDQVGCGDIKSENLCGMKNTCNWANGVCGVK